MPETNSLKHPRQYYLTHNPLANLHSTWSINLLWTAFSSPHSLTVVQLQAASSDLIRWFPACTVSGGGLVDGRTNPSQSLHHYQRAPNSTDRRFGMPGHTVQETFSYSYKEKFGNIVTYAISYLVERFKSRGDTATRTPAPSSSRTSQFYEAWFFPWKKPARRRTLRTIAPGMAGEDNGTLWLYLSANLTVWVSRWPFKAMVRYDVYKGETKCPSECLSSFLSKNINPTLLSTSHLK